MEECCWERLGIDPTADTAAIKKAYAKQLKANKPDKNPEGFKSLRTAYERALEESYWYEEAFVESDFVDNGSVENEFVAKDSSEEESLATVAATNPNSVESAAEDYSYENQEGTYSHESELYFDEVDFDNTKVAPFFFESSAWAQEWDQVTQDIEATSDSSDSINSTDQRLQALLQAQLEIPRSLDEQKDFEEALFIWFEENLPLFTLSYQLVKSHFRWDKRLENWSHNDYPWYMLDSLDERYKQVTYFQSPTAFHEYLTRQFPILAIYWTIESLSEKKNEYGKFDKNAESINKRFDIFIYSFFPFRVTDLANELQALDAELDYYIHDHPAASEFELNDNESVTFNAHYWRNDSSLNVFRGWILHRFIRFKDFVKMALVIAIVLTMLSFAGVFSLFPGQSTPSVYHDGLGVFVVMSLYYLFWQLQLRLFATPNSFVSHEPWSKGWRNASMLLFILGYVSWLDISNLDPLAMPTSPVYFLTHLAGASLFAANSMRQSNIVVTMITWHAGIMLLVVAVIIPKLIITVGQPPYTNLDTLPISPLFWLLLAAPALFISLSDTYPRLEWLANVGYKLLNVWYYLMLIGGFILFTYCADVLPKIDFGFTAITIMLITIIMASGLVKILITFDEN